MKAVVVQSDGRLQWQEVDDVGVVHPEEVRIRVQAVGVNRADLLQRRGQYPPPVGVTPILGLECAGMVVEVGSGVSQWKVGDRVCALLAGGAYAEYVKVHSGLLFPVPNSWSIEQAAALPEALCTATINLIFEAQMKPSELVLIHSAAGGVGSIAVQLVSCLQAVPIATAGTAEKVEFCTKLGAALAFNYKEEQWWKILIDRTGGVDIVLDTVGAAFLPYHLQVLRYRGRLVLIGLLGGPQAAMDLRQVLLKNLRIYGSTLRNRPLSEKIQLCEYIRQHLWSWVEQHRIVPVLDSVFDIREAESAHQRMQQNLHIGKIVLRIPEENG